MTDRTLGIPRNVWSPIAAIFALIILGVSLLPPRGTPGVEIADLGETWALALHGLGYALLTMSALFAQRVPRVVVTAILVIGYGILLEFVQGMLGLRSAQISDVLANTGGVLLGVAISFMVPRRS